MIAKAEKITRKEAIELFNESSLLELGKLANSVRNSFHPKKTVTFVIDRNVNYTNICVSGCSFCAFYRGKKDADAYILTKKEILDKTEELVSLGGTQLLMQGGLNPDLKIEFFEELFREIKKSFPQIDIHSLSPAEIDCIASASSLTIDETIERLQKSGLDSIPGGGAEILVDDIRKKISPLKIGWERWSQVMFKAAEAGMSTTATMMFGAGESAEDIIEHLFRIRELQESGGSFRAFIPWTYQPGNTGLGGLTPGGVEYLRVLAISRIILDNIPNIQGSWVTQGGKMAQIALFFGANDLGGTMLEENVVAAAGCSFRMTPEEIISLIKNTGFTPLQRNTAYNILREFPA